jgi:imidazolonepropionase-like amidohydrolase
MRAGYEVAEAGGLRKTAHANEPFIIRDAITAGTEAIEHGQFLGQEPALIDLLKERDVFLIPCANSWSLSAAGTDERRDCQRLAIRLGLQTGVKLAVGTDLYTEKIVDELAWFTEGGATPLQALQAATLTGAQLCGLDDTIGSIEPGKFADLVVIDGDPSTGLTPLAQPSLVVVDGVPLTPREILAAVGPVSRIRAEAR